MMELMVLLDLPLQASYVCCIQSLGTVSYTHLDVYKRQGYSITNPNLEGKRERPVLQA